MEGEGEGGRLIEGSGLMSNHISVRKHTTLTYQKKYVKNFEKVSKDVLHILIKLNIK